MCPLLYAESNPNDASNYGEISRDTLISKHVQRHSYLYVWFFFRIVISHTLCISRFTDNIIHSRCVCDVLKKHISRFKKRTWRMKCNVWLRFAIRSFMRTSNWCNASVHQPSIWLTKRKKHTHHGFEENASRLLGNLGNEHGSQGFFCLSTFKHFIK